MPRSKEHYYYTKLIYLNDEDKRIITERRIKSTSYPKLLSQISDIYEDELDNPAKLLSVSIARDVIPVEARARKRELKRIKEEKRQAGIAIYDGLDKIG